MLGRKRTGSVVCRSCGRLVGVGESRCPHCGARSPSLFGFAPALRRLQLDIGFTEVVIAACVGLYLLTLVAEPAGITNRGLSFLAPSPRSLVRFGASGLLPVLEFDRWWTVLSAGWLHGDALHILFNVMWIRSLGPLVVSAFGGARTVILYTVASAVGFLLSTVAPLYLSVLSFLMGGGGGYSVGASAAIFGLLAAAVRYGRRHGQAHIARELWGWAVFLFVWGVVGGAGIDNWAHLGGFAGGWLTARLLDPVRPERIGHVVAALLCIAATLAAIVASVLVPLPG